MKKLILLSCLVSSFYISYGQTFKPDLNTKSTFNNHPAYLLDTIVTSTFTKQQLYSNALNYVTKTSSDNVLEIKDLDLGEVAFKGTVSAKYIDTITTTKRKRVIKEPYTEKVTLHFKGKIYVKDHKFKIVLSSLEAAIFQSLPDFLITLLKEDYMPYNKVAKDSAMALIKKIANFMNQKPENEF